jgi:hypothetical protein
MKGSEPTMPVNGAETLVDTKTTQPSVGDGRNTRSTADSKAPPSRGTTTRRRRDRQDNSKASGEERFFLASGNGHGDVPALGRECASEAEAIIDAFRERVNFFRVAEFQTRADVGPSGEPILRKDGLKKTNPAS